MSDFVHVSCPVAGNDEPLSQDGPPLPTEQLKEDGDNIDYLAFLKTHPFARQTVIEKIHGCIFGSALGDTIGLYTEFLNKEMSAAQYPTRTFQLVKPATKFFADGHRLRFAPCAWTDDTDQALLIILGYLHLSTTNNTTPSPATLSTHFAHRLRQWLTQGLLALDRPPFGIGALVGSTVTASTYLSDPAACATERWVKSGRYVAPNGSVMRTHPVGVLGVGMSEDACFEVAAALGRTTHVDPRCVVGCCVVSVLIRGILRGEVVTEGDLDGCIERSYAWVKSQPELMNPGLASDLDDAAIEAFLERGEFERHLYAKSLEDLRLDEHNKIGYVYKCVGSGVVLLRQAIRRIAETKEAQRLLAAETLFEELIVKLIMDGGDADTNGAVAGALLGAYLGYSQLPSHWTRGLSHREWLAGKTGRLAMAVGVVEGNFEVEKDEAEDGGVGFKTHEELEHRSASIWADIAKKTLAAKEERDKERAKAKKKGIGNITGWFQS